MRRRRDLVPLRDVYPDGPAPYYSVYAPGRPGQELERWDEIKLAASEAILVLGTITHHHAVGRDHRRWYVRERHSCSPARFAVRRLSSTPPGSPTPGYLMQLTGSRELRPRRRQMMSGVFSAPPLCPDPRRYRARCSARS